MPLNPLVQLILFISLTVSILLSPNLNYLNLHIFFFVFLSLVYKIEFILFWKKVFKILYFFPFIIFFYFLFTILMTNYDLIEIFEKIVIGFYRLLLIISFTTIYFENSKKENLITIIRSFFYRIKLHSRFIENITLFLSLSFRFYPEFQKNWELIEKGDNYLGIKTNKSYLAKVIKISKIFPRILLFQLDRSSEIARVIKLRGYGNIIPRGIIDQIDINFFHFVQSVFIILIFYILHNYVTI